MNPFFWHYKCRMGQEVGLPLLVNGFQFPIQLKCLTWFYFRGFWNLDPDKWTNGQSLSFCPDDLFHFRIMHPIDIIPSKRVTYWLLSATTVVSLVKYRTTFKIMIRQKGQKVQEVQLNFFELLELLEPLPGIKISFISGGGWNGIPPVEDNKVFYLNQT